MNSRNASCPAHPTNTLIACKPHNQQSGAAAVEFALTVTLIFAIFFTLLTFSAIVWGQQKISYLAAEGGRYAVAESALGTSPEDLENKVCSYLHTATASDAVLSHLDDGASISSISCSVKAEEAVCPVNGTGSLLCAEIVIEFNMTAWPLLNMLKNAAIGLSRIGGSSAGNILPSSLESKAVVQIINWKSAT